MKLSKRVYPIGGGEKFLENKNLLVVFGVLLAVVVVAVGYFYLGGGRGPTYGPAQVSPTPATVTQPSPSPVGEVREINVIGDEYKFSPSSITLKAGERVRVVFRNGGRLPHNFSIDELGIATETIPAGQTAALEFTAQKSGTLTSFCSVGNHRALGMEGKAEIK